MPLQKPSLLDLLPTELLLDILMKLSYEDLLECRKTCHHLQGLIDESVALRYKMQLAVEGMEDNQRDTRNQAEKLALLQAYHRTWNNLHAEDVSFTQEVVRIEDGPAWEFTGGVLSQSIGPRLIQFKQLPSSIRGIKSKAWTVQPHHNILDFTADPGQDLLVVMQTDRRREYRVRLLSMSTGDRHREARREVLSFERRGSHRRPATYEIRISGPYLGVMSKEIHSISPVCHLSIWEWRTGNEIFSVDEPYWSFCFFDEHYLLIADFLSNGSMEYSGSLVVHDLVDPQRWRWQFQLPTRLQGATAVSSMELLCEPGSTWTPSSTSEVPFYVSREDRLVVLVVHVQDDRAAEDYTLTFSMLASKLLPYLQVRDETQTTFIAWKAWGEQSCRAVVTPFSREGFWPCCVYGTKHIVQEDGQVVVYDFNPHAIQEFLSSPGANDGEACVLGNSDLEEDLFNEKVVTSLPYRRLKTKLTVTDMDSLMLSEDSFIIVEDVAEQFHITSL